jgi:hypothetical protein
MPIASNDRISSEQWMEGIWKKVSVAEVQVI